MPIYQTYVVGKGDTLTGIARAFGVDAMTLQTLNAIKNRNVIKLGQTLRIRQITESYHLAAAGDKVADIAANHGVTQAAIASANGIAANAPLSDGQRLIIPAGLPAPAASSTSPIQPLGSLSRKYEVGKNGPETVSIGKGDRGGVSYGTYQLASKLNRPKEFLAAEGAPWAAEFAGTTQGTPAFSDVWKKVARREPQAFGAAQHAYIERTHYAVQLADIVKNTGVDLSTHSSAMRNVIWSCAVQHGPDGMIVCDAMKTVSLAPDAAGYDRALIDAIYAERGRRDPNGRLTHFRNNSIETQESVATRFKNERNDAIAMLDAETTKDAIVAAVVAEGPAGDSLLERVAAQMSDEDAYRLMEKYGDDEARSDWMAGRKVCVALRRPTNWKTHELGLYDDPMLLIWRDAGSVKVERFWCTTEPAGAYAFGHSHANKGSSVDMNKDGRPDMGRLCAGTYHFDFTTNKHLGQIYMARAVQVVDRDVNQDGSFTPDDPASGDVRDPTGAQKTMYIHKGGATFTGSAGCQTLAPDGFNRFLRRLGGQSPLSYILINME